MQAYTIRKTVQAVLLVAGFVLALLLVHPDVAGAAEAATGRPGETFTVNVERAPRGREVTAELAGATASAIVDRSGSLRLDIVVPDVAEGEYALRLRGGLVRNIPFQVQAAPAPPPTAAAVPVVPAVTDPTTAAAGASTEVPADVAAAFAGAVLLAVGLVALISIVVSVKRRPAGPPSASAPLSGPPVMSIPLPWTDGEPTMPLGV